MNHSRMEEHIELEGCGEGRFGWNHVSCRTSKQACGLAHISGKMRKRFIRLTIGDRVKIEMSPMI